MPVIIELQLKASWPVQPDTRQLHGLACALFEHQESEHLGHDKPFAVWPLRAAPPGSVHDWDWRAAWLPAGPPPASVIAPEQLRLGHVTCEVTEAAHRSVSHARLASGPPIGSAALAFKSPVFFSQNGTDVVIPDPRLIAGSWRRRWNASVPDAALEVGEDAWRDTHRALHLADFDLRTQRRDSGRGRDRTGFTGTATLRLARDAPAAARGVLGTLARFAEFCGTGAQTTHGFGATMMAASPLVP
jgi:CRISPR-associated endoribonuclease Cas6